MKIVFKTKDFIVVQDGAAYGVYQKGIGIAISWHYSLEYAKRKVLRLQKQGYELPWWNKE